MRAKLTAILFCAVTAAFASGCSDDETTNNNTVADTGMMTPDTGMMTPETGMMTTDTGTADMGTDAPAPLPTGIIDRIGRPAVATALITGPNKDAYNKTETYASPFPMTFQKDVNDSLIFVDMLDGTANWALTGGVHPLRDPLLGDFLIVDTSKPCPDKGSYLDVELFVLGLRTTPNTTCGGRTLNDDVMDTTLTALVTKLASPVKDNVNEATKPATNTFPYLAAPN